MAAGVFPVDQVNRLVRLAGGGLHLGAVFQQGVDLEVGRVGGGAGGVGGGLKLAQGAGDEGGGDAALGEVVAEQPGLDVAVVLSLAPITEVAVAQALGMGWVGEEFHDPVLGRAFGAY